MEFLTVYLIIAPFLCLIGAALLQCVTDKIKTALAQKTKAVSKHSCSVEKLAYHDNETRKAV